MDDPAHPDPDPRSNTASASVEAEAIEPPSIAGPPDSVMADASGAGLLSAPRGARRALGGLGWRTGIALGILAFLAGLAVMALVAVRYGASFGTSKTVATPTTPVDAGGQTPLVIVPGKSAAAMPGIDLATVSSRQGALAAQLSDLEAREAALDRSAARASGYATRSEGLMIAFAARRAIDRGLRLGFLEDQLRARFGDSQPRAVATIVQAANTPVTLEDLRAGLDGVAPELLTGAASTGWLSSLRREIGNLVVLRRAGTPSPLPIDRIARARRLVEAGQVEAALSEVAHMPGAPRAERWTGAARRYIGARAALDTIESSAILAPDTTPIPGDPAGPVSAPAQGPAPNIVPQP